MVIVNKNENATGFLTIDDLEPGEVFRFQDGVMVYLITDGDCVIDVETGAMFNIYEKNFEYRPVERVNCHLVIE